MEVVQSSAILPMMVMDLGKPPQVVYPAGRLNRTTSQHHHQGSSSNMDCKEATDLHIFSPT